MKSLWENNVKMPAFKKLDRDIKTDVLIIGGGIAGILCAYMLNNANINYILAEADTICSKTTKNTTAKITSQHGLIYSKLEKEFGLDYAKLYLKANEEAVKSYRDLCKNIDCDFETKDNYVYYSQNQYKLDKEISTLNKLNSSAVYVNNIPVPVKNFGAIKFENQAQFNPLKFISSISKNLNIYEHTRILEIDNGIAKTDKFSIKADKIIVATHFPFINKHGLYFMKMYQHRSYVIALENAVQIDGMYVDDDDKGMSFRNYNNFLLVGGGGHRTGKSGGNFNELVEFKKSHFPNADIKYQWATQDCMTLDGSQYIGQYSKNTPNLFTATGFNKWGMTSSMLAANILTDLIMEKDNEYAEIFSPSRTMIRPQLALNSIETITNMIYPTVKRCSHMGCALKWNNAEHTWDCSCHGSRFDRHGNLIDNPANKNADV
ncbi:MAG: FAD-dependent oxidoreductase [Acetobacter sp.]|nr:FAD-dependent oxidoreductase [Bacteroides sp.]MCM1340270.1 FAD-dependent oxidoreductase [Acetobacter sp.]MCM1432780.1 FAD-dependent oxidoreductase [Clostridiales bacterium]